MDEWSTKKKIVVALIVLLVFSPLLFLSDVIPGRMQSWTDNNPESPWAPWMQMKVALIYNWTLRQEKGYACYEKYLKHFGPDNPNYDRDGYMQMEFERAVMTGEIYSRGRGMEELRKFAEKYRGLPIADKAKIEHDKLRFR